MVQLNIEILLNIDIEITVINWMINISLDGFVFDAMEGRILTKIRNKRIRKH